MNRPDEIIIKSSPIVFLGLLILVELLGAAISFSLLTLVDLRSVYNQFSLTQHASFSFVVGLVLTTVQLLVLVVVFFFWFVESYRIDPRKISHQRVTFFGIREMVDTQTIADIRVKQSWSGRTFNFGGLELVLADSDKGSVWVHNIPNPNHYAAQIRNMIRPRQIDIQEIKRQPISDLIARGEGQYLEFKSSFSWDYRRQSVNRGLNKAVMKNITGYMNTTGGILLLGVDDEGQILGLETEFQALPKPNVDGFENGLNTVFNNMIGAEYRHYMQVDFEVIEGRTVCRILVLPTPEPVFLRLKNDEEYYIRTGNGSQPLSISQAVTYIQDHFGAISH
jgi:hypothetical protein